MKTALLIGLGIVFILIGGCWYGYYVLRKTLQNLFNVEDWEMNLH